MIKEETKLCVVTTVLVEIAAGLLFCSYAAAEMDLAEVAMMAAARVALAEIAAGSLSCFCFAAAVETVGETAAVMTAVAAQTPAAADIRRRIRRFGGFFIFSLIQ